MQSRRTLTLTLSLLRRERGTFGGTASGSASRVARHELPWVHRPRRFQPQRGCGSTERGRRNPFGVGFLLARFPKVARASQPWALRRNPFGIHSRNLRNISTLGPSWLDLGRFPGGARRAFAKCPTRLP